MTKTSGQWVVYEKRGVEYVHVSKPFKTKQAGTAATGFELQAKGAWCRFHPVCVGRDSYNTRDMVREISENKQATMCDCGHDRTQHEKLLREIALRVSRALHDFDAEGF
jgi:hypothetical protein